MDIDRALIENEIESILNRKHRLVHVILSQYVCNKITEGQIDILTKLSKSTEVILEVNVRKLIDIELGRLRVI